MFTETSEEIPSHDYVFRVYRALGERGILKKVQAVLVGRPKTWEFDKPQTLEQRKEYRERQREAILKAVRKYNDKVPVIQNMDFGHTDPQIPLPYGMPVKVDAVAQKIYIEF